MKIEHEQAPLPKPNKVHMGRSVWHTSAWSHCVLFSNALLNLAPTMPPPPTHVCMHMRVCTHAYTRGMYTRTCTHNTHLTGALKYYVNGEWRESQSGKTVPISNPTTQKTEYNVQGVCTFNRYHCVSIAYWHMHYVFTSRPTTQMTEYTVQGMVG